MPHKDDTLTIVAIASLGCVQQDLLHEGLGHAVTAWLSGASSITLSTVALQSDISTRWISASGTLVNIAAGAVLWAALRAKALRPATRYFLVLAMAGNLFTGTGYFLFSGVANFGDWAAVIRGLEPHWAWRVVLIAIGVVSYTASMRLVAGELEPFKASDASRIRRLCLLPYVVDGALAAVAGMLNPLGVFYVIASALPSTLGANAGLLYLPAIMEKHPAPNHPIDGIDRSGFWIAIALMVVVVFVLVFGRGIALR